MAALCVALAGAPPGHALDSEDAFSPFAPRPTAAMATAAAGKDTAVPDTVAQALARAGMPASSLSALVIPVQSAETPLVRYQADREVNPASVMKLVTTYAAIDLLGPDFTWSTRFYTDGKVDNGVLRGNLYIRGGGDPKLVLERIQEAFYALHQKGVTLIMGDMVLDHSAFELPEHNPGAFDGEALRPYNAAPDGLLVNFKSVVLKFVPDTRAGVARVVSEPPLARLTIDETVPLSNSGCGDWRGDLQAHFDDPDRIRFSGRYSRRCGERVWPVAYQDPASFASRAMEGLWRASGGALSGQARTGLTPPGVTQLYEAQSLPLKDIITDVNQWSNNVMAQQVFLTLGQLAPAAVREMKPATGQLKPIRVGRFEHSREVIRNWWVRTLGLKYSTPRIENGSGLSRDERVTPSGLAALLLNAAQNPKGQAFMESLSVAGVTGTAARIGRSQSSPAHGNAWLKTGTLKDVSGIAGYVLAQDGQRYVVVGFINHDDAPRGRAALEALVEWTAARQP